MCAWHCGVERKMFRFERKMGACAGNSHRDQIRIDYEPTGLYKGKDQAPLKFRQWIGDRGLAYRRFHANHPRRV